MKFFVRSDKSFFGQLPVANFSPDSLNEKNALNKLSRSALSAIVVAIIVCFLGYLSASSIAFGLTLALSGTSEATNEVLSQQAKHKDVLMLQSEGERLENARSLATSREIMWQPFTEELLMTFTPGAELESLDAVSLSSTADESGATAAGDESIIASIDASIKFPNLPEIEKWLRGVSVITGYKDSTLISIRADGKSYVAEVRISLNSQIFERRFKVSNSQIVDVTTPSATPAAGSE